MAAPGFLLVLILGAAVIARGQDVAGKPGNIAVINPRETMDQIVAKAAHVIPSPRQLAWQALEFIAFVHFGTNTFSDREWGLGTENPANFNPSALDARQETVEQTTPEPRCAEPRTASGPHAPE